ncbi:DUF4388 domain-containing protein [Streptosporangium canum]|uniref:DUF4388 domain-containing protein n=1 Tax=Streptosporangium canum TaxID=324952 RepID=UPI003695FECA
MATVESVLSGLADDRATGTLRLGKAGMFYLTGGRVTYAESAAAPRLEDLLTAGRRVSAHAVRQARQSAGEDRRGGELLVAQGVLTRGELEFCVLNAVLDAVYFLFDATGHRPRFRPGDQHWLGPQWYFDVTGLLRECRRRRTQLDQAWPSAELDTLPVVPVGRVPCQRVVLTSLQWEVLVGADSAATPGDLARKLGRPAYSVLLAVRQLAAAGLIHTSAAGPGDPEALPRRTKGDTDDVRSLAAVTAEPSGPSAPLPPTTGDPTDVNLLIRLRNALEALS